MTGRRPHLVALDRERPDLDRREHVVELVRAFYREVAMDDLLGPVFAGVPVDWPEHIPKLVEFWCWQLFGDRGYDGNPLRAHESVHARHPFRSEHYERWLELFDAAVDERFAGPTAELAKQRARRMARAMQRLLETGASPAPPAGGEVVPLRRVTSGSGTPPRTPGAR
jgi:hemoglobin